MNKDNELMLEAFQKRTKGPTPNTLKAQQMLDQAVGMIMKAANLSDVNWHYADENNPDVDLQNALENIKDFVGNLRNEDAESAVKPAMQAQAGHGPQAQLRNSGAGENAESASVKEGDFYEAHGEKYVCVGVEEVDGQTMVHGVMLADAGDSFPMSDVTKVD